MAQKTCDYYQPLASIQPECVWYDEKRGFCTFPLLPWDSCLTGKQCLRCWLWEGKQNDFG